MTAPNYDALMVGLKVGETVEQDGVVFFHMPTLGRGCMNAKDWRAMQSELVGFRPGPPVIDEHGRLKGVRFP